MMSQPHTAGGMGMGMGGFDRPNKMMNQMQMQGESDIIVEKDSTIVQLKETIEILELKIKKLEQLVKLKDTKI